MLVYLSYCTSNDELRTWDERFGRENIRGAFSYPHFFQLNLTSPVLHIIFYHSSPHQLDYTIVRLI